MADKLELTIGETYSLQYIGNPQKYIQQGSDYTFIIIECPHGLIVKILSETRDCEGNNNESDNPVIINYSNLKSIERNWKEIKEDIVDVE